MVMAIMMVMVAVVGAAAAVGYVPPEFAAANSGSTGGRVFRAAVRAEQPFSQRFQPGYHSAEELGVGCREVVALRLVGVSATKQQWCMRM